MRSGGRRELGRQKPGHQKKRRTSVEKNSGSREETDLPGGSNHAWTGEEEKKKILEETSFDREGKRMVWEKGQEEERRKCMIMLKRKQEEGDTFERGKSFRKNNGGRKALMESVAPLTPGGTDGVSLSVLREAKVQLNETARGRR